VTNPDLMPVSEMIANNERVIDQITEVLEHRIWKCAWCGCWFNADGPTEPKVVPLMPSHGCCECCLEKEKRKLEAMKATTP
jgi:hypothetical protein